MITSQPTDLFALGAEALPGGFADIERTLRTYLESLPEHMLEQAQSVAPQGLLAIAARWME